MRMFLTALFMLSMSMPILAQDDTVKTVIDDTVETVIIESTEPYIFGVGVQLGLAAGGIATENAEGRKVNSDFWFLPTYGAVVYAPFSAGSKIGGRLDVGVTTTGTRTRPYEQYAGKGNWEGYFIERYTMFCIAPSINMAGLNLGVGFNFPMKAERWNPDFGGDHYIVDQNLLKSMAMDFRIGGMIKVWQTKVGKLYVDLSAKYYFSGLYNDDQYLYGVEVDALGVVKDLQNRPTALNLTPASAHIGISYLFNLGL